jgi:small GTP-binding protein
MSNKKVDINNKNEISIKTILIGESNAGKTSIIHYFIENKFNPSLISTIGCSNIIKKYAIEEKEVTFNIWDTAGQERFRGISHNFYNGADIAILVYDITSSNSYIEIKKYWYQEVKKNCPKDTSILNLYNIIL